MATRLDDYLAGRRMPYGQAGRGVGVDPNMLRYGTTTGRILIDWDGARQPTVWTIPPPAIEPQEARLELARRHFHVLGPSTAEAFGQWAGIREPRAKRIVEGLGPELLPVRTAAGDRWILAADESAFREPYGPTAAARLIPSGDTFFLFWGADRELLVPDRVRRDELWTSRVWPGAVLIDGEVVGTWRRAGALFSIQAWRTLTPVERDAVVAEAERLPIPGLVGQSVVTLTVG